LALPLAVHAPSCGVTAFFPQTLPASGRRRKTAANRGRGPREHQKPQQRPSRFLGWTARARAAKDTARSLAWPWPAAPTPALVPRYLPRYDRPSVTKSPEKGKIAEATQSSRLGPLPTRDRSNHPVVARRPGRRSPPTCRASPVAVSPTKSRAETTEMTKLDTLILFSDATSDTSRRFGSPALGARGAKHHRQSVTRPFRQKEACGPDRTVYSKLPWPRSEYPAWLRQTSRAPCPLPSKQLLPLERSS